MATIGAELHRFRRPNAQPGEVEEITIASHCWACAVEIAELEAGPEGKDAWSDTDELDYDNLGDAARDAPTIIERKIKE